MPLELVPDEDPERHWTVNELSENLRMSRTEVIARIDSGRFGPYLNVGTGSKVIRRVPESGRQFYMNSITIQPRRTA